MSNDLNPPAEWFRQYMNHVAANVVDRTGNIRFRYHELRTALDAVTSNHDEQVPQDVLQLFSKIVGVLPQIPIDEKQERVLFLALLNCHMAYLLTTGFLLNKDDSVNNNKVESIGSNNKEELF